MGYNPLRIPENTINTMGTLLGVHPIVPWHGPNGIATLIQYMFSLLHKYMYTWVPVPARTVGTFFTNTLSKQTKLPWFVPLYKPVESVAHQYATSNHGTDADHGLIASQVGQERHGAHDEEQCTTSASSESFPQWSPVAIPYGNSIGNTWNSGIWSYGTG